MVWGVPAAVMSVMLALSGCSHEGSDWKAASAADTSEAYQQFLQQHPNSANAAQARTRLQQLQEDRDWQAASSADTRDAYEQFALAHPDGKWTQEARIRIENFAQTAASGGVKATGTTGGAGSTGTGSGSVRPASSSPAAPPVKRSAVKVATASTSPRYVQLGAFSTRARAESAWKTLTARFPRELKALKPHYVAGRVHAHEMVRLQVAVASRAVARDVCTRLKKHAQSCVAVSA
jgi:hypothetical protein